MKRMKIMVAAIALCGLAACSDNTPKSFTGTMIFLRFIVRMVC